MPVLQQGIDLALKRILKEPAIEQVEGIPEPEQLARRETPLGKVRIPQQLLAGAMPTEAPPEEVIEPTEKIRIPQALLGGIPKPEIPPALPEEAPPVEEIEPAEPQWWESVLQTIVNVPLKGMEQTFTAIGAFLTMPMRPRPKEEPYIERFKRPLEHFMKTGLPAYFPGGAEYEAYQKWKGTPDEPETVVPLPSWRQMGAWLRPVLKNDILLNALGIDPTQWEEPERFEWARMGMADTAELAPLLFIGGGGKKAIDLGEELLKATLRQTVKGKPVEEAINIAFDQMAKKGRMPKFVLRAVPEEVPIPKPEIPAKPPVKPPVAEVVRPEEAVITKVTNLVEKARPARKELELIKSTELRKKIPEFTKRLEAAKTFEEAGAARIALKGKLIPPGADIVPIADRFTAKEVAQLINAVNVSEVFAARPLTRANILDALKRIIVDGKLPTETEIELIGKIFPKLAEAILKRRPLSAKAWELFLELANLPRAVIASGDLSASLRQMVIMAPRYPIKAIRATWAGARAGWSALWYRDYATTLDKSIHASRFAPIWEQARLYVAPLEGVVKMAKREEAYMSSILSRLGRDWPQFGLLKKIVTAPALPVAKLTQVSEAAFITTLNKMRTDVFSKYAALWGDKATLEEFRALAEVINIGTGRGIVPRPIEGLVPILNTVLFSTRLQLARVEALGWPVTLWKYPPKVRRMVIGNIVAFLGTITGILGVLDLSGLARMEKDPKSADFGKVRIGNTRLDPWGGFQQYVVLINRLLSGELKTADKRIVDIDREDTLIRFLGMKLSPAVGFIRDVFRGETFLGEELTLETEDVQKQAYERLVPMFMRDVLDALREDGWTGALTASPGFLGVGVVSYPSPVFANWVTAVQEFTGKEWTTEEMIEIRPDFNKAEASWLEYLEMPSGRGRDTHLKDNPEIEATLYFWGEVKSLSTPEARDKVNEMLEKHNLPEDILPIREVEPWEPEEKEEPEIWADLLNMMPKYASDYIQANEAEWRARDLSTFIPQIEEVKNADTVLIDKYNRAVIDADSAFRAAYLADNPEIDAARLFWKGYKTAHSKEALNLLRAKADTLGIPYEAIPALQRRQVAGLSGLSALLK